jgi:hypothetical protein
MYDLIGKPYRPGSDGSDGYFDCIHLVYTVLQRLDIPHPLFNPAWYDCDWRVVLKALREWGTRTLEPSYDGDVVLLSRNKFVFGVVWQSGILYINDPLETVTWNAIPAFQICRAYRHASCLSSGN